MPSGSRAALTTLALLLVVLASTAGPAHAALEAGAGGGGGQQIEPRDARSTTMTVDLRADGDARWTVAVSFDLATSNETEAFRTLAAAFEDGETSTLGLEAFRRASSLAAESTGREMSITDVERSVSPDPVIANGTGRLVLSFTWAEFARVEGDRLTIGDAFETPEGTWLPGLASDQTLVVRPPEGFGVVSASVAPRNGTLRWSGPVSFGPDSLSATFTGADGTDTPGSGPTEDGTSALWAGLVTLGVGALVTAYIVARRRTGEPTPDEGGTDRPTADTAVTTATTGDTRADDDPSEAGPDEELLSDEERIEHLLEANGGRMKQASIVRETGWSNAKVSQLLSAMEDQGRIDKLRIGRENLISFPDEDVTDLED